MPHREIQIHSNPGLWPPTWPMGITMLRMFMLPFFLWAVLSEAPGANPAHPHRWLPISIFALMAITDKLDGYLARKLGQATRLGAILDPLADKLLVGCCVILFSFDWVAPRGYALPLPVVIFVYGKDVLTAVGALILLSIAGKITIHARPLGKLSTLLQLTLVMGILLAPPLDSSLTHWYKPMIQGFEWATCILAAASTLDYVFVGRRQLREIHPNPAPPMTSNP